MRAGLDEEMAIQDSNNDQANDVLEKKRGGESGMRLLNLNQVGTQCSRAGGGDGNGRINQWDGGQVSQHVARSFIYLSSSDKAITAHKFS